SRLSGSLRSPIFSQGKSNGMKANCITAYRMSSSSLAKNLRNEREHPSPIFGDGCFLLGIFSEYFVPIDCAVFHLITAFFGHGIRRPVAVRPILFMAFPFRAVL